MSSVFVVVGYTDYEGSDVVKVFAKRGVAESFAARCTQHERKRPEYPDDDNSNAVAEYERKFARWTQAHPAGEYSGNDSYVVQERPFVE